MEFRDLNYLKGRDGCRKYRDYRLMEWLKQRVPDYHA
jgi:hypothetical protein